MINAPRNRRVATLLAVAGAVPIFGGIHLVGLHKLYLGQRWWCLIYIALAVTGSKAAWIAGLFDAAFYLFQNPDEFDLNFNSAHVPISSGLSSEPQLSQSAGQVMQTPPIGQSLADQLYDLDQLRQDGLISEYEFEQKRRKLLE